jgi:uncharacterized Tic20 family protein
MTPNNAPTTAERAFIVAIFASSFLGLPIIGPLAIWLWRRKTSAFADAAGRALVNLEVTVLLYICLGLVPYLLGVLSQNILYATAGVALLCGWVLLWSVIVLVLRILAFIEFISGRTYSPPRFILRLL